MEMHNLIFIGFIGMFIIYGTTIMVTDFGRTNAYVSTLNATSVAQLNESLSNMTSLMNQTGSQVTSGQTQGTGLDILLGLSQNVFNGAKSMFQTAAIMTGVTTQLVMFNQFVPAWVLNFIIPAIFTFIVIGVLFYLSKVK